MLRSTGGLPPRRFWYFGLSYQISTTIRTGQYGRYTTADARLSSDYKAFHMKPKSRLIPRNNVRGITPRGDGNALRLSSLHSSRRTHSGESIRTGARMRGLTQAYSSVGDNCVDLTES